MDIDDAKLSIGKDYKDAELLLVYGKSYTDEEFKSQMSLLFPSWKVSDGIPDLMTEMQVIYGITGWWTWRSDNPTFVVGHTDYYVLKRIRENDTSIAKLIPDIDWYYMPGLLHTEKRRIMRDNIDSIEILKI
jgi:hypothetical protein